MSDKVIDPPYAVPHGPSCPRCGQKIVAAQDVTPDSSNTFRKGKILICSNCVQICMVGDSKLLPMSRKQVLSLEPRIQLMLLAACRKLAAEVTKRN